MSLLLHLGLASAAGRPSRLLLKPEVDPRAERVELFAAIEAGQITARMQPRNARGGAIFIENHTNQPLTVELPATLVGVQVLPQFDGLFPGPNSVGATGNSAANAGQGANQPVGASPVGIGGPGGTANGNVPFNAAPFNAFFSIPPERIARVEYVSVCLEYGAVDPRPGNVYRLVRVEEFSADPRLSLLLEELAWQGACTPGLQAAAWHVANGLSWEQLQALKYDRVNGPDPPLFQPHDLIAARTLVSTIDSMAGTPAEPAQTVSDLSLPQKRSRSAAAASRPLTSAPTDAASSP